MGGAPSERTSHDEGVSELPALRSRLNDRPGSRTNHKRAVSGTTVTKCRGFSSGERDRVAKTSCHD